MAALQPLEVPPAPASGGGAVVGVSSIALPALGIERWFAEFEFTTRFLLGSSDCEPLSLGEALHLADARALELWQDLSLGYTESAGLPTLRDAVAELHSAKLRRAGVARILSRDVLVVTPQEGIQIAMHSLLRAGDTVVVCWPCYQSLSQHAVSLG
jgi:aspartate/methionine/tyrosine aminotransferase